MGLIATLREGMRVALGSLFANKVRSFLTILGIAIGVIVVVLMAAVIEGINTSFTDAIASAGPNTFYLAHAPFEANFEGPGDGEESAWMRNDPLDPKWAPLLERLPEIEAVEPIADLSQSGFFASADGEEVRITLAAVGPRYLELSGGDIRDGRYFSDVEEQRRAPVAVVDSAVAADLWLGRDPLLRSMNIGQPGRRQAVFRTIGTYEPPNNLFSGFATHYVLIPFSAADKNLRFWDRMITFMVVPEPTVTLDQSLDAVRGRMRQLRGLAPGQDDDFALVTQDEVLSLWGRLTGVLFAVAIALSGVGLMVGGIGVVGIMMISVTERTREIGLRKALGARRRDLILQFLVEAASPPIPAVVPLWSVVVALFASVLTGVGFGLYPAARGAALDPVDALRYE